VGQLGAQSVVTGTVRDDSGGRPVVGAEVVIEALGRRTQTDGYGRYLLGDILPGTRVVLVRAVGYHPLSLVIHVGAGDTARADVALEATVFQLAPLEVTEPPPRGPLGIGREGLEDRQRLGFGRFIDSSELRRTEHLNVDDVLRRHTGVAIAPVGVRRVAMSARSRDRWGRLDCFMQVVLDGMILFRGGRLHADPDLKGDAPDLKRLLAVAHLEAIEIYRSAAETPMEFGGVGAACGTIVLWTRRGP
jgi:hypothetical protein